MKEVISIPNASRTFEALRSLGYDLYSSIADVVDNSITEKVGSSKVNIDFDFKGKSNLILRITDNGCGMNQSELEEAMRLGTETTYIERDLGKFGMGMKTASLSHCNVLTVLSKKKNKPVCGYRWDMDRIDSTQNWVLLQLNNKEIDLLLKENELEIGKSGTIVMWDDLFILDQDVQLYNSQKLAQNYYFRLLTKIKLHLGMIYHRFLDGSIGKELQILLNDESIEPWDPFCRSEKNTKEIDLKKSLSEFKQEGYDVPVTIRGFVLPNKEGFSNEEAWKNAKGLLSWNDSQGYYIYRSNRIIRFGGWHNTKAKDEHDKLARISIDIDPSLDELFRITVNKTKVQFPEVLFNT
ncbi:ATP-binding protein [Arenibacter sp. BSSL-BM3]|uniref:ATP-binding protein n=1 Tax=Arenibacter arenosicollis TaxID=2762274 RepID=A0ABR7QTN3_9FLAO|nr:ATP-binding protein [Arenibacter arenosicollis]MBC8770434.1 ATP-binding protein [Arenibacter arenosicollis]